MSLGCSSDMESTALQHLQLNYKGEAKQEGACPARPAGLSLIPIRQPLVIVQATEAQLKQATEAHGMTAAALDAPLGEAGTAGGGAGGQGVGVRGGRAGKECAR